VDLFNLKGKRSVDLASHTHSGLVEDMVYSVVLLVHSSSYGVMSWYPPIHLEILGKNDFSYKSITQLLNFCQAIQNKL